MIIRNIPEDIIREHILPYTYTPQSCHLCEDIRNCVKTNCALRLLYKTKYPNDCEDSEWLSNDIGRYMNEDQGSMYGFVDFFINIYRRKYMLTFQTREFVLQHIKTHYCNSYPRDINICLGLMNSEERNGLIEFIKKNTE